MRLVLGACLLVAACGRTLPYGRASDAGLVPDAGLRDAGACPVLWDATTPATLRMTADDEYRLFVNGVLIDDTPRLWHFPQTYTVNVFRHPARRSSIAIAGTNQWKIDGLDRGVIAELRSAAGVLLGTDHRWRLTTTPVPAEWEFPGFNDSAWVSPTVIGLHGIPPWGSVLGTSRANWLWSYLPSGPQGTKPELEQIWLRRTFFLQLDGGVAETPTPCP